MSLIHIVYTSAAAVEFSDRAVQDLLERARRKNQALDITGILLLVDGSFFQILEGPPDAVTPLYETIGRDARHGRVTRSELRALPGLNDFFATRRTLEDLGEGRARTLLGAFREGRFRARVGE